MPPSPQLITLVRDEQVRHFRQMLPVIGGTQMAIAALTALVFYGSAPISVVGVWLGLVWLAGVRCLLSWLRNRNKPPQIEVPLRSLRGITWSGAAMGAIWGVGAFLLFPPDVLVGQALLSVVVAGMTAGAAATLWNLPSAGLGFMALAIIPLIVRLMLVGEAIQLMMATMIGVYLVAMALVSRFSYSNFVAGLAVKAHLADIVESVNQLRDGLVVFDADERLVFRNEMHIQMFPETAHLEIPGAQLEELVRARGQRGVYPEAAGREGDWLGETMRGLRSGAFAREQLLADGRWILTRFRRTKKGGLVGIRTDITEQKRADEAVRESEAQLSAAIENIRDGFVLCDPDNRIFLVNNRFRRLYPNSFDLISKGTLFEDFLRGGAERGEYPDAVGGIDDWLNWRLSQRKSLEATGSITFEQRLIGDRWVRVSESQLPNGGMVAVHVDISEIRQAKEEADLASQAKSEFLSAMSHDLRTPLNSILGFSQVLRSDPEAPLSVDQEDSVEHITKAGKHLLGLINEVLDLTRIESGAISLSPESVVPRDVVGECLDLIRPLAEDRGVVVNADLDEELPAVEVDYARLKDVLLNLLSNAVKYNREQGTVAVTCRPTAGRMLRLSVADTGYGIPEERLAELFLPFSRLGAESSEIEGSGIGLTIAKRLVELMDGEIGVETTVGKGSVFWIELPLAPQEPLATEPGDASAGPSEAETASLASGAAIHKVLYVEDNPANLQLMRKLIARRPNCSLIEAESGEVGLDLAASERPDIVIMDIDLPGIDGFETLRRLHQSEGGREVPVIALSANAMPDIVKRGLKAGFSAYLTKPVDVPVLMDTLDAALEDKAEAATKDDAGGVPYR